jgi:hypothetical protein
MLGSLGFVTYINTSPFNLINNPPKLSIHKHIQKSKKTIKKYQKKYKGGKSMQTFGEQDTQNVQYVRISEANVAIKQKYNIDISQNTLRQWISKLVYPELFVKFGGKVYVDLSAVPTILKQEQKKLIDEKEKAKEAVRRMRADFANKTVKTLKTIKKNQYLGG